MGRKLYSASFCITDVFVRKRVYSITILARLFRVKLGIKNIDEDSFSNGIQRLEKRVLSSYDFYLNWPDTLQEPRRPSSTTYPANGA
jgi:hypothetical protein